jgi:hypothetical protein
MPNLDKPKWIRINEHMTVRLSDFFEFKISSVNFTVDEPSDIRYMLLGKRKRRPKEIILGTFASSAEAEAAIDVLTGNSVLTSLK